jgi:REP element-mobilizing transposase RayT
MRTRYRINDDSYPYFITCTIIEWLPVFTRTPYFEIIVDSLKYCRERKGLKVFAYVIMDNHLHMVANGERLGATIKEFKSYTARGIIKLAAEEGKNWLLNQFKFFKARHKQESRHQVWQEGFHPQLVSSEEMLGQKVEYIHDNPVKAGLVAQPEDWLYSSAKNYWGEAGVMEIDVLWE